MLRKTNSTHQKELIETSSQLRKALGKHEGVIKKFDPLPRERERTKKFREKLIKCFGKRCAICNSGYQVDAAHIVPLEIGGETEVDNLILLCREHHTLYDTGHMSINSMKKVYREWREGCTDFSNRMVFSNNISAKSTIAESPIAIRDALNQVLVSQRERKLKKASDLLKELRNRNIPKAARNYLFIKLAEITRRRDMQGTLNEALDYINNVDLNSLPKEYLPAYDYEKVYIHRLAGFHRKAAKMASLSAESLKRSEDIVQLLAYVAISTNELLCELAEYDKPTPSQVKYLVNKLNELEKIAQKHGEYWGGRWAFNCAAHRLQVYIKAKDNKSLVELEKLISLYYNQDVRTGWDSGAIQSISLLKGLASVLFLDNVSEANRGVELLARSFTTRLKRSQRFEGIRDTGFGLVIGFRKLGKHLETAKILSNIMNRTIDGTSYIWPWIA